MNVKNGTSRIEVNGTPLVNHAIADCVVDLIGTGIQPAEITVLCYYQGQRRLVRQKIYEKIWADEIKNTIGLHTVDAFQGQESSVVILDLVTARDPPMFKDLRGNRAAQRIQAAEDELDNGSGAYIKLGAITGHVRSGNRLNFGLTRAMNGHVVVCQESILVGDPKMTKNRGKHYKSIRNMCANTRARGCYLENDKIEDIHTQSLALRQSLRKEDIKVTHGRRQAMDLGFISDMKDLARDFKGRIPDTSTIKVPKYRTTKGHTIRPIEESPALIAAEKHDKEQERLAKGKEEMELVKLRPTLTAEDEEQLRLATVFSKGERNTQPFQSSWPRYTPPSQITRRNGN